MVMESSDHDQQHKVMTCSTIALLQERFRQLERVKEMREERALLKLLRPECEQYYGGRTTRGESATSTTTNKYYIDVVDELPASRLFFRSEIIHPTTCSRSKPPPPSQQQQQQQQLVHFSLWPNSSEIHRHRHHRPTNDGSNYFGSNIVTTKMPSSSITKSWLIKDAPLTGSCSIKVDHNMITTSTVTAANHDVDTSLHL